MTDADFELLCTFFSCYCEVTFLKKKLIFFPPFHTVESLVLFSKLFWLNTILFLGEPSFLKASSHR